MMQMIYSSHSNIIFSKILNSWQVQLNGLSSAVQLTKSSSPAYNMTARQLSDQCFYTKVEKQRIKTNFENISC